jgi:transposase
MPGLVMDGTFLLDFHLPDGFEVTSCEFDGTAIVAEIRTTSLTATCPQCGVQSSRIYSRYTRRVRDVPCGQTPVSYVVTVRKFLCGNRDCLRKMFCERIAELAAPRAQSSGSLTGLQESIGFSLGGEAGSRLAEEIGVPVSPDTLLRRVRRANAEARVPPRFVGVDDWAFKKGQRYGTVLIDLERRRLIELFEGRDGEPLKKWLLANPQVEVITRDRWPSYAQAANEAAPQAKQVADRWHLLKNLREAVERILARYAVEIRTAHEAVSTPNDAEVSTEQPSTLPANSAEIPTVGTVLSPRQQATSAKQQERSERHKLARELHAQGKSLRDIAARVGCSTSTIKRYLRDPKCPDWRVGRKYQSALDEHEAFIDEWIAKGERKSADLAKLLTEKGCQVKYDAVCRYVKRKLGTTGRPGPRTIETTPPAKPAPTARSLSFAFINPKRESDLPAVLTQARSNVPSLDQALILAEELAQMFRQQLSKPLSDWITLAEQSEVGELKSFAKSLQQDQAAIEAAMVERWSNGPVEGHVNRLKLIKRTMYGRAKFDLLRARSRHRNQCPPAVSAQAA